MTREIHEDCVCTQGGGGGGVGRGGLDLESHKTCQSPQHLLNHRDIQSKTQVH